jgi:hypothetical protein
MGNGHLRISLPGQTAGASLDSKRSETPQQEGEVLAESVFHAMLTQERRRAERSGKPFLLMLLDANPESGPAGRILGKAADIIVASKRETDLVGWYKAGAILGVIFTEVSLEGELPITERLRSKMEAAFVKNLGRERADKIAISLHMFPEGSENGSGWLASDSKLYHDLKRKSSRKRVPQTSRA